MNRTLYQWVAGLLLPLYCVLAGWGYALHDWAACRDACCSRGEQSAQADLSCFQSGGGKNALLARSTKQSSQSKQTKHSTPASGTARESIGGPRGGDAYKSSRRCSCPAHANRSSGAQAAAAGRESRVEQAAQGRPAHGRRPQDASASSRASKIIRSKAHVHDAATCSVCHVLAQLKVGYQSLVSTNDVQQFLTEPPSGRESIRAQTLFHSGDVRGPPAHSC